MAPEYCFPGLEWHLKDIVNFNIDDQFHLIVMLNSDRILQAMKMDCNLKDISNFWMQIISSSESKTYGIDGI
jgi:hypothetical protein